jgi:hypothetical protein
VQRLPLSPASVQPQDAATTLMAPMLPSSCVFALGAVARDTSQPYPTPVLVLSALRQMLGLLIVLGTVIQRVGDFFCYKALCLDASTAGCRRESKASVDKTWMEAHMQASLIHEMLFCSGETLLGPRLEGSR